MTYYTSRGIRHDARVVAQLYGSPYNPEKPTDGHRGSCLSASFEIVAGYQAPKTGFLKQSTLPLPTNEMNGVTVSGTSTVYAWNQALIHHYVWAQTDRLLDLVTADKYRILRGVLCRVGLGWAAHTISETTPSGYSPRTGTLHTCLAKEGKSKDDYYEEAIKALMSGRLPIIRVKNIAPARFPPDDWVGWWLDDEDNQGTGNNPIPPGAESKWEEEDSNVPPPPPGYEPEQITKYEHRHTSTGHAMVITGFYENEEGDRYLRIIDPEPSLKLRDFPAAFHILNPKAIHPLNHIRWVLWEELEQAIRSHRGLVIISTKVIWRIVPDDEIEDDVHKPGYLLHGDETEELRRLFNSHEGTEPTNILNMEDD